MKIGSSTPAVLLVAASLLLAPLLIPLRAGADAGSTTPGAAAATAEARAWTQRLATAHGELEASRARVVSAQAAVDEARSRHWPLGDALAKLEQQLADAKQKLATEESAWPELLEEARRAGVPAEVLRPYED